MGQGSSAETEAATAAALAKTYKFVAVHELRTAFHDRVSKTKTYSDVTTFMAYLPVAHNFSLVSTTEPRHLYLRSNGQYRAPAKYPLAWLVNEPLAFANETAELKAMVGLSRPQYDWFFGS